MTGVYKIITKNNIVYKYLNKQSDIGKILSERLKHKNHLHYFNFQIVNGHKKDFIGKHIVVGNLFRGRGDYVSPKVFGVLLSEIEPSELKFSEKIQFLYSIQELINNLFHYKKKFIDITGDWTLHNLIWENKTGNIINIDLEGFYTYSKYGPPLQWHKKENNLSFIKNEINKLKLETLGHLFRETSLIEKTNILTLIYLPTLSKIQWLLPIDTSYLKSNIKDRCFKLDLGELEGYKKKKFKVYLRHRGQDKISFLIKSYDTPVDNRKYRFYFSFEACIEKGYEHPIKVSLINKKNPERTVLNICEGSENSDIGDFYISKFYK